MFKSLNTSIPSPSYYNITSSRYDLEDCHREGYAWKLKDGRSDVFIELIEGMKEYNRQLKLTQTGDYNIVATATSAGKIVDADEYLLTIAGEKQFDYRLLVIIVFVVITVLITLLALIR